MIIEKLVYLIPYKKLLWYIINIFYLLYSFIILIHTIINQSYTYILLFIGHNYKIVIKLHGYCFIHMQIEKHKWLLPQRVWWIKNTAPFWAIIRRSRPEMTPNHTNLQGHQKRRGENTGPGNTTIFLPSCTLPWQKPSVRQRLPAHCNVRLSSPVRFSVCR